MISSSTFNVMAATFNRLNARPVIVFASDKCQQQPLLTMDDQTTTTTSIINDTSTFTSDNSIHHTLYQQFCIMDPQYGAFLDFIRYSHPTQDQVDSIQDGIVLCDPGPLTDHKLWSTFNVHPQSFVMTVSRRAAQRINAIVVNHLFSCVRPLSDIPCTSVVESNPIFPQRNMRVIFTENRDKQVRVVNGQEATIISAQNRTIILKLPEGQHVFVYPVTSIINDLPRTYYPFTPAYAQTITKSQGQNIKHLVLWLDSPIVPAGTGYVGLSRICRKEALSILQPIDANQLQPVRLRDDALLFTFFILFSLLYSSFLYHSSISIQQTCTRSFHLRLGRRTLLCWRTRAEVTNP